tara:strand:- start:348 stop:593 length:246 start_codon:yes stop_codon:yes gene_type:complete
MQTWIDECCDINDDDSPTTISANQLYHEYKIWAMDSGEWQMNKRTFYQKLEEHGFQKVRHSAEWLSKGLSLKPVPGLHLFH